MMGVEQCVAVCCSALKCVAVRCSVLQCVAVCCSVWVHTCAVVDHRNNIIDGGVAEELAALELAFET